MRFAAASTLILLVVVIAALSPSTVASRTWRVPGDVAVIQAGVDSAAAGDTVLVAPGTYAGIGNRDIEFRGREIVVRGAAGAALTVVDVQATLSDPHRGFFIGHGEGPATVLEGFTIINGYMGTRPGKPAPRSRSTQPPGILHDLSAGGVKCQDSSPQIRDLVIRNCGSEYTGGGISVELLATPLLERCVLQGCYANFGGALSIETRSMAIVRDCVITGNKANVGGGINTNTAQARFDGCVVSGNRAAQKGGALMAGALADVLLERTIVWGNCGDDGGGEYWLDLDSRLGIACCAVDSTDIVRNPGSLLTWESPNVFAAPRFCFPLPCNMAPVVGGDFQLQAGSPCLATASPCGQVIGPLGGACPSQTHVESITWTHLKRLYQSASGTP